MTALPGVCGSCGTTTRDGARFCDACGFPLTTAVDAAEYKQVTVLFADVVRSMDIAATVDAERLREILTELVERSAAVVRRYDGGTVEYTGDGVMAIFGAPVALEDHAFRACIAALEIQEEAKRLAAEVARRDEVTLRLRVGLSSGRVIVGEMGSSTVGYAATGEPLGFAQRMESVAPPGAVMLSESTARLVEHTVRLAEPEWVRIKGVDAPVRAWRLEAVGSREGRVGRADASLVGRGWEMASLEAMVDRVAGGRGGVVDVVGPPGIGKSRVARETAALAASRGFEVYWAFCESHANDIPFGLVTRLLRATGGLVDLGGEAARRQVRERVPDADPQDLLLLDDLLGIADPDIPLPPIDPDARRHRLTALINTAQLARTEPALYVIEDAQWIDEASESMIADLLAVIAHTPSMALITARPEYQGALTRLHGAQMIALAPLTDTDTAALIGELLGSDPSVGELAGIIAEQATGNPFFAEEMVRELVQRGVLTGERGGYVCGADVSDVAVPATVQAAIEARIDRLGAPAKRTLNAASVIGARFEAELLAALELDVVIDELLGADLIDQVRYIPSAEYAFRHPLIRAVVYESQLKSDRAEWHRRVANVVEKGSADGADQNAALIAEHLESAGESHAAYGWRMRAGAWSTNRDVGAARVSWERARRIADHLPDDDADKLSMRIAPRTMLCATDWQAMKESRGRFEELRVLCDAAGDKVSLAIAMNGLEAELLSTGRSRAGARLASEQMGLLESIDDPALTIGLAFMAFNNWWDAGAIDTLLRWTDTAVELAGGDPAKGGTFGFGSPLAGALAWRGVARWWLGRPGWQQDLEEAMATVRPGDPTSLAMILGWTRCPEIHYGVVGTDDATVQAIEETFRAARGASDAAFSIAQWTLAAALLNREAAADRDRGLELIVQVRDMWARDYFPFLVPIGDVFEAREHARRGDRDVSIPVIRRAVHGLHEAGRFGWSVWGIVVLVETLLERGTESDHAEAQRAIDQVADLLADQPSTMLEITLLRLRTLMARARGDENYHDLLAQYQKMSKSLGYESHMAWAEALA